MTWTIVNFKRFRVGNKNNDWKWDAKHLEFPKSDWWKWKKFISTQFWTARRFSVALFKRFSKNGFSDVGDGCWRRNVLATTLRCGWRFWPFLSPTSSIFQHKRRAPTCNQRYSVTYIQKLSPSTCHQHLCSPKSTSKLRQTWVILRTSLIFHRPMHFLQLKKETLVFENLFTPYFILLSIWFIRSYCYFSPLVCS